MTPEGKVKWAVRELLKEHGAYWHCPVQNGMGKPSLDFVGCHRGRYFAVETKADGKKMTKRQELTAEEIIAADGRVFEVVGTSGLAALQHWLMSNQMEVYETTKRRLHGELLRTPERRYGVAAPDQRQGYECPDR